MVLNSDQIVTSPGHKISVLKNKIEMPDKVKLIQKTEVLLVNIKYKVTDENKKNKLFKCESKTAVDNFKITDNNKKTVYKFNLKKAKGDFLNLFINDKNGKEEKVVSIEKSNSSYRNVFIIRYTNEETHKEEVLYAYVYDRKTDFFYGGRQIEGGLLICECGRYDFKKQVYDIEFAPDVDKTFLFILMLSLTRYVQAHNMDLPLYMGGF
jgi:uncharacterized protein Veg